jgi:type II secretory pathway pseudopilin PulG
MRILVNRGGQQLGPFSLDELRGALASGQVSPTDLAWWEGAPAWVPVSQVPGLTLGYAGMPGLSVQGSAVPDPASGLATGSLILGIISLLGFSCFTGIPAVICGHMAIGRQKRAGANPSGVAVAGLITGYLSFAYLIFIIPLMAAIAVPSFMRARDRAMSARSLDNAQRIMVAIEEYRAEHGGQFPASLDNLGTHLPNKTALVDPYAPQHGQNGFWYSKPTNDSDDEEVVLAGRGTTKEGLRTVGREDGSVQHEEFNLPLER